MDSEKFRAQGDVQLTREILQDSWIQQTLQRLNENDTPLRVRRNLLATAVRLTPGMSSALHDVMQSCRDTLAVTIAMETYVYASPQFNAMCIKPEEGRLFVAISSSLLDQFDLAELRFVLGHELAHYVFRHHEIPVGYFLKADSKPDPAMTLRLFAWSRYAEISADRAGAMCSKDLDAIARAMFKLASGLTGKLVQPSMAELLKQLADMQAEDGPSAKHGPPSPDWFSTHPFSPLRLQALVFTFESELMRPDGCSLAELETKIDPLMSLMKPSYLEEDSHEAETMRRLLFAGAVAVADASGGMSADEIKTIERFLGEGVLQPPLDTTRLKTDLNARLKEAMIYVAPVKRVQVFRDLVLVGLSDKKAQPNEKALLDQIANALEIPQAIRESLLHPHIEEHRNTTK
jgi:Zn-dependent protease with chaperone function/tellurite resistance protein